MENYNREEKEVKKYKFKYLKIAAITVLFVGTGIGMFYGGNVAATKGFILTGVPEKAVEDLGKISDSNKYSDLFELRSLLMAKYDGDIDDTVLLEGAMKGMASALGDPYTVYMNSEEYKNFIESNNNFYGIGAQIGVRDEKVVIIAPIEGSPADRAGIKSGDIILQVDDYEVTDANSEEVVSRVRGEEGVPVKLVVRRGEETLEFEVVREQIQSESVKGEMIEGNIGYIQVTTFSDEDVSIKFTEKLNELKESGMEKLILDLRGNPGGYLDKCVEIASNFIPEGEMITYTIDKYDNKQVSLSKGGDAIGMPLVVLVDRGSASASEVVTGALKDNNVATVVGTTTFGKGIVQQLIPFVESDGDTGAIKVTTSKYYCPNGENIHGKGIEPDITVELSEEVLNQDYSRDIDAQFQKALEVIREK
ncbi:MAG: S41 family peptidase [Clostridium sp.]|nr:S41 family peptidase [Clostridium sp.]